MKKIVIGAGIVFVVLVIVIAMAVGADSEPEPSLAERFGCDWIQTNHSAMIIAGQTTAYQHVANLMSLELGKQVTAADAQAALEECNG